MISARILKLFSLIMLMATVCLPPSVSSAGDLPTAAGSPIAGISFDDRPLMLPVQRNFQMAMLTASSELGRSCGKMEAYGWRMDPDDQSRANLIFNNSVDRLRAQGFAVESKKTNSVSSDVTLFTADRTDRHLIFLWSAGEIGLVMVLCDTSAPLPAISENNTRHADASPAPLPSHLPMAQTIRSSGKLAGEKAPVPLSATGKPLHAEFKPNGRWVGDYTCSQGTTGATLQVDRVKGDQFEGSFSFYPTAKNPYVPKGKYMVFGEYDADSQRILINPGKWVDRPKDFYNTIMIGSFDPVAMTFSGYFQGITGCTSFEAKKDGATASGASEAKTKKTPAKKTAKPKVQKTSQAKPAKPVKTASKPSAVKEVALVPALDPVKAPLPSFAAVGQKVPAKPVSDAMAIVKDPAPVTARATLQADVPSGIVLGAPSAQK